VRQIDRAGELQPFWDSNSPPAFELQSRYTFHASKGPPLFMRYVEIYQDTNSITVACNNGLVHMLSHRQRSRPSASAYARAESAVSNGLVWIYFPMDFQESISTVWICEIRGGSHIRSPTIIVRPFYFLCLELTKFRFSCELRVEDLYTLVLLYRNTSRISSTFTRLAARQPKSLDFA
jgi:hypothetical protein